MYKNRQNGITLIALIITIIVMLILITVVLDYVNEDIVEDAYYVKNTSEQVTQDGQDMKNEIRNLYN